MSLLNLFEHIKKLNYLQTLFKLLQKFATRYFTTSKIKYFVWAIIIFGFVLRFSQFLFNRSLEGDESMLALNIIHRTYLEFLRPLDFNQAAPFLFLVVEKFIVQLLGNSDIILRIFPFICGIFSLYLFYKVASYNLDGIALLIAQGLFSIIDPLIYYSTELKQYSCDIAVTLLLLLITFSLVKRKSLLAYFQLGLVGAISIWFSFTSVFVLSGIGLSLGILCLKNKNWKDIGKILFISSIWSASFIFYYIVSLKYSSDSAYLVKVWHHYFLPVWPFNMKTIEWYIQYLSYTFKNPGGLFYDGLATLTFVVGIFVFWKKQKSNLAIIISPIVMVIVASIFHKYPFGERLILFIVPMFIILIAEGIVEFLKGKYFNSSLCGLLILILIFINPLFYSIYYLKHPRTVEEIKPIMEFLQQNTKKDDIIFLYRGTVPAFNYYAPYYGLVNANCISSGNFNNGIKPNWFITKEMLDSYKGMKRFWVVISHLSRRDYDYEVKLILGYLNNNGREITFKSVDGASAFLFDLSNNITNQENLDYSRFNIKRPHYPGY